MTAFTFGDPNLFVQGVVEQKFRDPTTGDIIGYDKIGNEAAITYAMELSEIVGGFTNQLIGLIPHSARLSGTYTSQAFDLRHRAHLVGGTAEYNGIVPICEEITVSGTTLTVTGTPVKSYAQPESDTYAWCDVHEKGASSYQGTNYGVDTSTKTVQNFTAVSGKTYFVTYYAHNTSALTASLPVAPNPAVVTVEQKWGVYARQNNSVSHGTLQGYLYVVVPLAMLEGDPGISGNQTTPATTGYNWRALSPFDNMPGCSDWSDCGLPGGNLAYYVYSPCGDSAVSATALVSIGTLNLRGTETKKVPVKYLMPDGSLAQVVYSDLDYTASPAGKVTVSDDGDVTGISSGSATIKVVSISNPDLSTTVGVVIGDIS